MKRFLNTKKASIIVISTVMLGLIVGVCLFNSFKSKASDSNKEMTAIERLQACRDEVQAELYGSECEIDTSLDLNEVIRVIVTLQEQAVADANDVSSYTSSLKSKESEIIKGQNDIVKKVQQLTGNKVINQTGYLVNSFSIDATRGQMQIIAKMDGVKSVREAVTYKTYMDSAIAQGNVKAQLEASEYGYTGEGIVIAVIDTGVNYEHQDMKLDTDVKTKFSKEEWKEKIDLLGYGGYMSEKVPFGYNYVDGENSCLNSDGEHGYHVSSIAAANGDIDGVAKNAQVIGMNVFGHKNYATSDDIVAAIEDAVKLGADIINLSLGCDLPIVSNDYEQVAINNASKEGVICCVAAGNAATSASDSGPKNLLNLKDTAMVGSLAVSDSALAVASAENIKDDYAEFNMSDEENRDIKMSKFSSWGPTNELGIKPEITAPGGNIKAACRYEDEYKVMNGTSMASPYIAGSQAVMLNAIKERGLDLKGQELAKFMKNSLMNTADVIIDKITGNPYPVRYQGAGLVDVYGAVDNDVIVTCNDEAKVELGEFEGNTTFDLEIRNYGNETCRYILNNTQIYRDYTDNAKWQYGICPVEGAYISYSMNDIVVEAGSSMTVTATVNIPSNYEYNSYVEAFISLEGKDNQDVGLPVLGFFGDWDSEPIIDKTLYDEEQSVINKNLTFEKDKIGSYIALINDKNVEKAGLGVRKVKQNLNDVEDKSPVEAAPNTNFDLVYLEENIESDIKYDGFIAEFSIKVQEEGYYTFELDNVPMSEITFKQAYDKIYGEHDNIVKMSAIGNLSKEIMLLKGREYRFKLHLMKKGIMNLKQGKIRFYKSSGENVYITETIYDSNLSAFSPNGDNINDTVTPSLVMLRCAREVKVNVLDSNHDVIRTIGNIKDVAKTTFRLDGYAFDGLVGRPHESLLYNNVENTYASWDGTIYNKQNGEYECVSEGQYYIQVEAKRSEDALPYVMEMPIKIDNNKPQINNFNIKKEDDDTIVEFNAIDNNSLKGNYYIDIEEKTDKGIVTYTCGKKYLETDQNNDGNYVLNLGNMDISKITLLVEDCAGNIVYEEYKVTEDEINEDEIKEDEDTTNIDVDLTDTTNDNLSEDVDNQSDINTIDINMEKESYICKSKSYHDDCHENIKEEIVLVDKKENYIFEFKVQGDCSENIEEIFNISAEAYTSEDKYGPARVPVSVKYENNDTVYVDVKEIKGVTRLYLEWESNTSEYCKKIYNITTSSAQYKEMCDANVVQICSNIEEISIIDNTMLNEDGTFEVKGTIHEMPDKLTVNGQEVEVNKETLEFSCNVPIEKGVTYIGIEAIIDGIAYFRGNKVNYEEISILLDDSINEIDGVVNVDNQIFNLGGIIKSYSSVIWIEINGDKVYTSSDYLMTTKQDPFEKEFNYVIKLDKGVNKIKLVVKTSTFKMEEKILTVNYM